MLDSSGMLYCRIIRPTPMLWPVKMHLARLMALCTAPCTSQYVRHKASGFYEPLYSSHYCRIAITPLASTLRLRVCSMHLCIYYVYTVCRVFCIPYCIINITCIQEAVYLRE